MDFKDIKKIVEMVKQNGLTEFEMEDQGFRLALKRELPGSTPVVMQSAPVAAPAAAPAPAASEAAAPEAPPDDGMDVIPSPMVGTFYRSPTPDTDAFVSVGDKVDEDTVVCIIEAMKVMNEIKAEKKGIIRKALADNASSVEFGQPLFTIEPA